MRGTGANTVGDLTRRSAPSPPLPGRVLRSRSGSASSAAVAAEPTPPSSTSQAAAAALAAALYPPPSSQMLPQMQQQQQADAAAALKMQQRETVSHLSPALRATPSPLVEEFFAELGLGPSVGADLQGQADLTPPRARRSRTVPVANMGPPGSLAPPLPQRHQSLSPLVSASTSSLAAAPVGAAPSVGGLFVPSAMPVPSSSVSSSAAVAALTQRFSPYLQMAQQMSPTSGGNGGKTGRGRVSFTTRRGSAPSITAAASPFESPLVSPTSASAVPRAFAAFPFNSGGLLQIASPPPHPPSSYSQHHLFSPSSGNSAAGAAASMNAGVLLSPPKLRPMPHPSFHALSSGGRRSRSGSVSPLPPRSDRSPSPSPSLGASVVTPTNASSPAPSRLAAATQFILHQLTHNHALLGALLGSSSPTARALPIDGPNADALLTPVGEEMMAAGNSSTRVRRNSFSFSDSTAVSDGATEQSVLQREAHADAIAQILSGWCTSISSSAAGAGATAAAGAAAASMSAVPHFASWDMLVAFLRREAARLVLAYSATTTSPHMHTQPQLIASIAAQPTIPGIQAQVLQQQQPTPSKASDHGLVRAEALLQFLRSPGVSAAIFSAPEDAGAAVLSSPVDVSALRADDVISAARETGASLDEHTVDIVAELHAHNVRASHAAAVGDGESSSNSSASRRKHVITSLVDLMRLVTRSSRSFHASRVLRSLSKRCPGIEAVVSFLPGSRLFPRKLVVSMEELRALWDNSAQTRGDTLRFLRDIADRIDADLATLPPGSTSRWQSNNMAELTEKVVRLAREEKQYQDATVSTPMVPASIGESAVGPNQPATEAAAASADGNTSISVSANLSSGIAALNPTDRPVGRALASLLSASASASLVVDVEHGGPLVAQKLQELSIVLSSSQLFVDRLLATCDASTRNTEGLLWRLQREPEQWNSLRLDLVQAARQLPGDADDDGANIVNEFAASSASARVEAVLLDALAALEAARLDSEERLRAKASLPVMDRLASRAGQALAKSVKNESAAVPTGSAAAPQGVSPEAQTAASTSSTGAVPELDLERLRNEILSLVSGMGGLFASAASSASSSAHSSPAASPDLATRNLVQGFSPMLSSRRGLAATTAPHTPPTLPTVSILVVTPADVDHLILASGAREHAPALVARLSRLVALQLAEPLPSWAGLLLAVRNDFVRIQSLKRSLLQQLQHPACPLLAVAPAEERAALSLRDLEELSCLNPARSSSGSRGYSFFTTPTELYHGLLLPLASLSARGAQFRSWSALRYALNSVAEGDVEALWSVAHSGASSEAEVDGVLKGARVPSLPSTPLPPTDDDPSSESTGVSAPEFLTAFLLAGGIGTLAPAAQARFAAAVANGLPASVRILLESVAPQLSNDSQHASSSAALRALQTLVLTEQLYARARATGFTYSSIAGAADEEGVTPSTASADLPTDSLAYDLAQLSAAVEASTSFVASVCCPSATAKAAAADGPSQAGDELVKPDTLRRLLPTARFPVQEKEGALSFVRNLFLHSGAAQVTPSLLHALAARDAILPSIDALISELRRTHAQRHRDECGAACHEPELSPAAADAEEERKVRQSKRRSMEVRLGPASTSPLLPPAMMRMPGVASMIPPSGIPLRRHLSVEEEANALPLLSPTEAYRRLAAFKRGPSSRVVSSHASPLLGSGSLLSANAVLPTSSTSSAPAPVAAVPADQKVTLMTSDQRKLLLQFLAADSGLFVVGESEDSVSSSGLTFGAADLSALLQLCGGVENTLMLLRRFAWQGRSFSTHAQLRSAVRHALKEVARDKARIKRTLATCPSLIAGHGATSLSDSQLDTFYLLCSQGVPAGFVAPLVRELAAAQAVAEAVAPDGDLPPSPFGDLPALAAHVCAVSSSRRAELHDRVVQAAALLFSSPVEIFPHDIEHLLSQSIFAPQRDEQEGGDDATAADVSELSSVEDASSQDDLAEQQHDAVGMRSVLHVLDTLAHPDTVHPPPMGGAVGVTRSLVGELHSFAELCRAITRAEMAKLEQLRSLRSFLARPDVFGVLLGEGAGAAIGAADPPRAFTEAELLRFIEHSQCGPHLVAHLERLHASMRAAQVTGSDDADHAPFYSLASLARGLQAHLASEEQQRKRTRLDLLSYLTRDDVMLLSGGHMVDTTAAAAAGVSARVAVSKEQLDALAQMDTRNLGDLGVSRGQRAFSPDSAGSFDSGLHLPSSSDPSVLQVLQLLNDRLHVTVASFDELHKLAAEFVAVVREDKQTLHAFFGTDKAADGAVQHELLDEGARVTAREVDDLYAALVLADSSAANSKEATSAASKASESDAVSLEADELMERLQALLEAGVTFASMHALKAHLQHTHQELEQLHEPRRSSTSRSKQEAQVARVASGLIALAAASDAPVTAAAAAAADSLATPNSPPPPPPPVVRKPLSSLVVTVEEDDNETEVADEKESVQLPTEEGGRATSQSIDSGNRSRMRPQSAMTSRAVAGPSGKLSTTMRLRQLSARGTGRLNPWGDVLTSPRGSPWARGENGLAVSLGPCAAASTLFIVGAPGAAGVAAAVGGSSLSPEASIAAAADPNNLIASLQRDYAFVHIDFARLVRTAAAGGNSAAVADGGGMAMAMHLHTPRHGPTKERGVQFALAQALQPSRIGTELLHACIQAHADPLRSPLTASQRAALLRAALSPAVLAAGSMPSIKAHFLVEGFPASAEEWTKWQEAVAPPTSETLEGAWAPASLQLQQPQLALMVMHARSADPSGAAKQRWMHRRALMRSSELAAANSSVAAADVDEALWSAELAAYNAGVQNGHLLSALQSSGTKLLEVDVDAVHEHEKQTLPASPTSAYAGVQLSLDTRLSEALALTAHPTPDISRRALQILKTPRAGVEGSSNPPSGPMRPSSRTISIVSNVGAFVPRTPADLARSLSEQQQGARVAVPDMARLDLAQGSGSILSENGLEDIGVTVPSATKTPSHAASSSVLRPDAVEMFAFTGRGHADERARLEAAEEAQALACLAKEAHPLAQAAAAAGVGMDGDVGSSSVAGGAASPSAVRGVPSALSSGASGANTTIRIMPLTSPRRPHQTVYVIEKRALHTAANEEAEEEAKEEELKKETALPLTEASTTVEPPAETKAEASVVPPEMSADTVATVSTMADQEEHQTTASAAVEQPDASAVAVSDAAAMIASASTAVAVTDSAAADTAAAAAVESDEDALPRVIVTPATPAAVKIPLQERSAAEHLHNVVSPVAEEDATAMLSPVAESPSSTVSDDAPETAAAPTSRNESEATAATAASIPALDINALIHRANAHRNKRSSNAEATSAPSSAEAAASASGDGAAVLQPQPPSREATRAQQRALSARRRRSSLSQLLLSPSSGGPASSTSDSNLSISTASPLPPLPSPQPSSSVLSPSPPPPPALAMLSPDMELVIDVRCEGLDKMHMLKQASPYLELYQCCRANVDLTGGARRRSGGVAGAAAGPSSVNRGMFFESVYKTETVKTNLSPSFRRIVISARALCLCEWDRVIMFRVWDENTDTNLLMGEAQATLRDIVEALGRGGNGGAGAAASGSSLADDAVDIDAVKLPLVRPELKASKKNYTNSGHLVFTTVALYRRIEQLPRQMNVKAIIEAAAVATANVGTTSRAGSARRKAGRATMLGWQREELAVLKEQPVDAESPNATATSTPGDLPSALATPLSAGPDSRDGLDSLQRSLSIRPPVSLVGVETNPSLRRDRIMREKLREQEERRAARALRRSTTNSLLRTPTNPGDDGEEEHKEAPPHSATVLSPERTSVSASSSDRHPLPPPSLQLLSPRPNSATPPSAAVGAGSGTTSSSLPTHHLAVVSLSLRGLPKLVWWALLQSPNPFLVIYAKSSVLRAWQARLRGEDALVQTSCSSNAAGLASGSSMGTGMGTAGLPSLSRSTGTCPAAAVSPDKESDSWLPLFTSEIKHDSLSPSFDPFVLDLSALSNGGEWDTPIQLAVSYSENALKIAKPALVGATVLTLREFITGSAKDIPLPMPSHGHSRKNSWGSMGSAAGDRLDTLTMPDENGALTANANQAALERNRTMSRMTHTSTSKLTLTATAAAAIKEGKRSSSRRPQPHPDIPLYKVAPPSKNATSSEVLASANAPKTLPPPSGFVCVKSVALLESVPVDAGFTGSASAGSGLASGSSSRRGTANALEMASLRINAVASAPTGVAALTAAASPAVASAGTVKRFATLTPREAGQFSVGASGTNGGIGDGSTTHRRIGSNSTFLLNSGESVLGPMLTPSKAAAAAAAAAQERSPQPPPTGDGKEASRAHRRRSTRNST